MSQATHSIRPAPRQARIDDDVLKQHLRAIAAGDKRAFKAFYEVTSGPCFGIVLRLVQDPDAAQDVLQKAYVSIWKNAGRYDASKAKAFTWIVVIMRNRALDALRARARAPETELIEESVIDPTQRTEARAEAYLLSRHLQKALNKLPDHVSMAVQLHVVEGYTSREIGELIDVSRNTVKTWIRRGLTSLRHDLPMSSYRAAL